MTSLTLDQVDTPCLVLDRGRLERNLARMTGTVARSGVTLRPHLKTCKSVDIARLAVPDPAAPVAVSTLKEAEYFFAAGYTNLCFSGELAPGKFARAARLIRQGAGLITIVDSVEAAAALCAFAAAEGVAFRTLIEVDSGEHRGGVPPEDARFLAAARALGPNLAGVTTHAGHSYGARSAGQLAEAAAQEARAVREAAAILRRHGLRCDIVSLGSSPTALAAADLAGITEIKAGVFMFWDLFQAGLGLCRHEDIAVTVLTEVISRSPERNDFLIDAGAFALSKDISTSALPPELQADYGLVCDIDGRELPGLRVKRVWQEHGLVVSARPLGRDEFPIGTRVRILPNHACPTAAAHDSYKVVDGGRAIKAVWPRMNGW